MLCNQAFAADRTEPLCTEFLKLFPHPMAQRLASTSYFMGKQSGLRLANEANNKNIEIMNKRFTDDGSKKSLGELAWRLDAMTRAADKIDSDQYEALFTEECKNSIKSYSQVRADVFDKLYIKAHNEIINEMKSKDLVH